MVNYLLLSSSILCSINLLIVLPPYGTDSDATQYPSWTTDARLNACPESITNPVGLPIEKQANVGFLTKAIFLIFSS